MPSIQDVPQYVQRHRHWHSRCPIRRCRPPRPGRCWEDRSHTVGGSSTPGRTRGCRCTAQAPRRPELRRDHPPPKRLGRDRQATLGELLSRQGRPEPTILLRANSQHLPPECWVLPGVGSPPPKPVDHADVAFGLQPPLNPPHLADASPQQSGRLSLGPLTAQHRSHHLQSIPFPLTHRYPVSVHPLPFQLGKRTFLLC